MRRRPTALTRAGYEKLREELEYLKKTCRREISAQIREAREQGDISENAEYDAAKEAQGLLEKKIFELGGKLAGAQIIDGANLPTDEVLLGATVHLLDIESGEEFRYILVGEDEADFTQGRISTTSPVGKALLNHKEGDKVKIKVPAGILKYRVEKITREE